MASSCFAQKLLHLTYVPIWVVLGVCMIAAPANAESLGDRICNPSAEANIPKYSSDPQKPERKPTTAFDFYTLATSFYSYSRTADERIDLSNRAITLAPNYIDAYRNRAKLRAGQKRYDLAIADYDRLRQLEPANEVGFLKDKAYLYSLNRQWNALIQIYDRLLVLQPENARFIHTIRARSYGELKDWDNAITEYSRSIALSKDRQTYPRAKSPGYYAEPVFSKQSIEPNPSLIYISSSRNLFFGFGPEPPFDVDYSLGVFMGNESLYVSRARIYAFQGKKNEAIADYTRAIKTAGTERIPFQQSGIYRERCKNLVAFGDLTNAKSDAQVANELDARLLSASTSNQPIAALPKPLPPLPQSG